MRGRTRMSLPLHPGYWLTSTLSRIKELLVSRFPGRKRDARLGDAGYRWEDRLPVMSGKRAFLDLLKQEGVEVMFGNPGTTELPLMDAFATENELRYVLGLQEAAVIAMADGYAQASGKLAAVNLHVAPGLGNAMGMLYDAQKAGAPILVTAGQHEQSFSATEPILWADLPTIARPLVKWSAEVHRLADLPRLVHRAAKTALAPPTGPVFLSLPGDIFKADGDIDLLAPTRVGPRLRGDRAVIEAAASLLAAAKRPVIMAGDAVAQSRAHAELVELAELLGAPVYTEFVPNTASFPSSHPLFRGSMIRLAGEVRKVLEQHDVLFSVGSDLFTLSLPSDIDPMPPGITLVHLDIDAWELGKNYPPAAAILGDPKATLPEITSAVREQMTSGARGLARERLASASATIAAEREALKEKARALAGKNPGAAPGPFARNRRDAAEGYDCDRGGALVGSRHAAAYPQRRSTELFRVARGRNWLGSAGRDRREDRLAGSAGRCSHRRRQRHVHLPGTLDGGALSYRRRFRDPQQQLVPHSQATPARDARIGRADRQLCRNGARGSQDRFCRTGARSRR